MKPSPIDTISTAAAKTSIASGGVTALVSFMSHEFLFGFIGSLLTACAVFINWYYRRKDNIRKAAAEARAEAEALGKNRERELRMELMRRRGYIFHAPETKIGAEVSDA